MAFDAVYPDGKLGIQIKKRNGIRNGRKSGANVLADPCTEVHGIPVCLAG